MRSLASWSFCHGTVTILGILLLFHSSVTSFVIPSPFQQCHYHPHQRQRQPSPHIPPRQQHQTLQKYASSDSEDYSETECQEMRDLIWSLSLEPTDHDRRTRVKKVFHEALARPNGMPKRFTDLFDKVLIEVGDEVQNEAKKKFFEDQAAASAAPPVSVEPSSTTNDEEEEDLVVQKRDKTPEELQLWALVDMMVQTKTIVKRENGELGNKGTFQ